MYNKNRLCKDMRVKKYRDYYASCFNASTDLAQEEIHPTPIGQYCTIVQMYSERVLPSIETSAI